MLSGTSPIELERRPTETPETLGPGTEPSKETGPATTGSRLDQRAGIADRSIDRTIPARPLPGVVTLPDQAAIHPPEVGGLKEGAEGVWSAPVPATSVADSRSPLRVPRSVDCSVEVAGQPRRIGPVAESAIGAGTAVGLDETIPWALRQAAVRAVSVSAQTGSDTPTPPPDQAVRLGESLRAQVLDGVPPTGTPTGDPVLRSIPLETARFDPLEGPLGSAVREQAEPFPAPDPVNNPPDESIAVDADVPGPWANREGAALKRSTVPDPRSTSPSGRFPMNAPETNDPHSRGGLERDAEAALHGSIGMVPREASEPGVSPIDGLRPEPSFRSDSTDSAPAPAGVAHTKPEGLVPPGITSHLATDNPMVDARSADASPVHQPVVRSGVPAEHIRRVDLDASGARGVELRIEEVGERLIVRTLDPMGTLEARGSQWTEMQQRLEASGIVLMPVETPPNASTAPGDDRLPSHGSRHDDCYDGSMNLSGRDGSAPRSSGGNGRTAVSLSHDAGWEGNPEDGGSSVSNPEPRGWWA